MQATTYREIAKLLGAIRRCEESGNTEWEAKHKATLQDIMDGAPSGSGIDCGTQLDWDASSEEKLVFHVSFHHMDENGSYDGWTEHTVTVRPSLESEISVRLSGRDRSDIKSYLAEVYLAWLLGACPK